MSDISVDLMAQGAKLLDLEIKYQHVGKEKDILERKCKWLPNEIASTQSKILELQHTLAITQANLEAIQNELSTVQKTFDKISDEIINLKEIPNVVSVAVAIKKEAEIAAMIKAEKNALEAKERNRQLCMARTKAKKSAKLFKGFVNGHNTFISHDEYMRTGKMTVMTICKLIHYKPSDVYIDVTQAKQNLIKQFDDVISKSGIYIQKPDIIDQTDCDNVTWYKNVQLFFQTISSELRIQMKKNRKAFKELYYN